MRWKSALWKRHEDLIEKDQGATRCLTLRRLHGHGFWRSNRRAQQAQAQERAERERRRFIAEATGNGLIQTRADPMHLGRKCASEFLQLLTQQRNELDFTHVLCTQTLLGQICRVRPIKSFKRRLRHGCHETLYDRLDVDMRKSTRIGGEKNEGG